MSKKKDNTALYLGIFILAIILIYGGSQGWFKGGFSFGTLNIVDLYERQPDTECRFTVDKERVCLGDNVTGTIRAKSPSCYIGFNYNNEGWRFAGIINETSVGFYKESRQAPVIGHYEFAAICGTPSDFCRTNNVEVDVINCDEDAPNGIEYTCGWTGSQCYGTCPPTHPTCTEIDWVSGDISCACLDGQYLPHPDWKPNGQYYDPHDSYNGDDEEPELESIRIFVTEIQWNGAMGGLTGMDQKCSVSAEFSGLGSGWVALASDSLTNANSRFADGRYVRLDGVQIADNKLDLFDGSLDNKININNNLGTTEGLVWSGSFADGIRDATNNCNDWGWVDSTAKYGASGTTGANWLEAGVQDCDLSAHIYCIEGYTN